VQVERDAAACEFVTESWFLLMTTFDTEWDWRERDERDHEAMKEDRHKSKSKM
jgi:hypothetical protein